MRPYVPRHPLLVGEQVGTVAGLKVVGRLRVTILSDGHVDYQVRRLSVLDKTAFAKALRAVVVKIEREQVTGIYGPTGETLTAEAELGEMA